jgi:methylated-DNA-[protein]-cysteine S-methyltransferase
MKNQAVLFEERMRPQENRGHVLQSLFEAKMDHRGLPAAEKVRRPQAAAGLIPSSPLGPLLVCVSTRGIALIHFLKHAADLEAAMAKLSRDFDPIPDDNAARRVADEISHFMDGDEAALRSEIDLSLVKAPFQRRVLELLVQVGPGAILTYSSLAAWAGAPNASRAVGGAMHDNPIPVYVPCHRVVRSDLSLGGYGGGLDIKHRLLCVEGFSFTPAGSVGEEGVVWGNRSARIFCRPGCRALARADRANALLFRDATRAAQAGMRPCRICCVEVRKEK